MMPLDTAMPLTALTHLARFAVASHALEEDVEGFALIVCRATRREEEDHLLTTQRHLDDAEVAGQPSQTRHHKKTFGLRWQCAKTISQAIGKLF